MANKTEQDEPKDTTWCGTRRPLSGFLLRKEKRRFTRGAD